MNIKTEKDYDDLDLVEAAMELEERLDIDIPDDLLEPLNTAKDFVVAVGRMLDDDS